MNKITFSEKVIIVVSQPLIKLKLGIFVRTGLFVYKETELCDMCDLFFLNMVFHQYIDAKLILLGKVLKMSLVLTYFSFAM